MALSAETKLTNPDRVLVLKPMSGEKPLSSKGIVDPRLFTGENKLHAIMDEQSTLWKFKYDMGAIPPPLEGNFTSFSALKKFAEGYFKTRNIEIVEVKQ